MISANYCRVMARYNHWQNTSLITAASDLSDRARWQDRGAFFGSIAATLNHLYWADALMLARLQGTQRPHETITHSLTNPSEWDAFIELRAGRDQEISEWAMSLTDADLRGTVTWYPLDGSDRVGASTAMCAAQLFNHQTHHRGQVHAMLTAAGAKPDPTDLTAMP